MLIGGYPNLELLEYKAKQAAKAHNEKYDALHFQADVFLQGWGSTALGFGGIGGAAMSEAYTTVFSDVLQDVHVVFFGNKPAYIVEKPTDRFFEDLKNRNMASVSDSKTIY